MRMPCLQRFIFPAVLSFLKGLIRVPMGNKGPLLLEDNRFKTVKRIVDYV